MEDTFKEASFIMEVDAGQGGYCKIVTFDELLEDVETEYGDEARADVEEWASNSKEGDVFYRYGLRIKNDGKQS